MNEKRIPEGPGVFNYRGDDEHGRMCYDGDWKNKAAHGYGTMKWQNGDRYLTLRLQNFPFSRPCMFADMRETGWRVSEMEVESM